MLKKIPVCWLTFSLSYALMAFLFHSDLMRSLPVSQTPEHLMTLERIGVFLSSVGFAVFICVWLSPEDGTTSLLRRIALAPLFFACYYGASTFQTLAIGAM